MGKAKKANDKPKTAVNGHSPRSAIQALTDVNVQRRAADGRNVDGWSSSDVSTYNGLLAERAKLEKEKNDLEYKAERRTTERALLNASGANIDSLFVKQPGGDFKYTGNNACCLDMISYDRSVNGSNSPMARCKHEICSRASMSSISWLEMDTIKYYELRIHTERTERRKNALRKQREVELVRVKKAEDEELAVKTRKTTLLDRADREALRVSSEALARTIPGSAASEHQRDAVMQAAKRNDGELSKIRGELEDIRRQVKAGKVASGDLRLKLDQAQGKMVEAERRNSLFRQMILEVETVKTKIDKAVATNPTLDDDLKTLCATAESAVAQAMTLMRDFFSASGPEQMEVTMSRLKATLEARGPMPTNMMESFKELESMVVESRVKGLKMDFKVDYGGIVNGNSMVDTMAALRAKMKQGPNSQDAPERELRSNLDQELVEANQGCLLVEETAEKEMNNEAHRLSMHSAGALFESLSKIKNIAVAKSPIPPLSDIMLEAKLQEFLEIHSAASLIRKAEEGLSDQEIAGRLTSLVLAKAQNSPDKLLMAYSTVAASLDIAASNKLPDQIKGQLKKVEISMQTWVSKHSQKNVDAIGDLPRSDNSAVLTAAGVGASAPKENIGTPVAQLDPVARLLLDQAQFMLGMFEIENAGGHSMFDFNKIETAEHAAQKFQSKQPVQVCWAYNILQYHKSPIVNKTVEDFKQAMEALTFYSPEPFLSLVADLYKAGLCAISTCLQIVKTVAEASKTNPESVERQLTILKALLAKKTCLVADKKWLDAFSVIASSIIKLHDSLLAELEHFSAEDPNQPDIYAYRFTTTILSVLLTFQESENAKSATQSMRVFLGLWHVNVSESIEAVLADLERLVKNSRLLCTVADCEFHHPEPSVGDIDPETELVVPAALRPTKPQFSEHFVPNNAPEAENVSHKTAVYGKLGSSHKNAYFRAVDKLYSQFCAYGKAELLPPPQFIDKLENLVNKFHGVEPETRTGLIHDCNLKELRCPGCNDCIKVLSCLWTGKTKEILGKLEPGTRTRVSKVAKERVVFLAKRRVEEIFQGKSTPQYLSWVVNNLLRLACLGTWQYKVEAIDTFEGFWNAMADKVPRSANHNSIWLSVWQLLRVGKARLRNIKIPEIEFLLYNANDQEPVMEELSEVFEKVAKTDEPFIHEAYWEARKLNFYRPELLMDESFTEALANILSYLFKEKPNSFNDFMQTLIVAFENGHVGAGSYFTATLDEIMRLGRLSDYSTCQIHFRNLAAMIEIRLKLRSVVLFDKSYKQGLDESLNDEQGMTGSSENATQNKKLAKTGKVNGIERTASEEHRVVFQAKKGVSDWACSVPAEDGWKKEVENFFTMPLETGSTLGDEVSWKLVKSKLITTAPRQLSLSQLDPGHKDHVRRENLVRHLREYLDKQETSERKLLEGPLDELLKQRLTARVTRMEAEKAAALNSARTIADANRWVDIFEDLTHATISNDSRVGDTTDVNGWGIGRETVANAEAEEDSGTGTECEQTKTAAMTESVTGKEVGFGSD